MSDQEQAWQENALLAVQMFGCIHLVTLVYQANVDIMMSVLMITPVTDVNRTWVRPTSENILSSKDIADGGWTKVQNPAQDIILAHLEQRRKVMNLQKLQLMNCLKTHSMMMRMLRKKLRQYLHMMIKKDKIQNKFRILHRQIELREHEQEAAVHMHLTKSFGQLTRQVIHVITTGPVSVFNKLSEI